jgi:hypothetical protein
MITSRMRSGQDEVQSAEWAMALMRRSQSLWLCKRQNFAAGASLSPGSAGRRTSAEGFGQLACPRRRRLGQPPRDDMLESQQAAARRNGKRNRSCQILVIPGHKHLDGRAISGKFKLGGNTARVYNFDVARLTAPARRTNLSANRRGDIGSNCSVHTRYDVGSPPAPPPAGHETVGARCPVGPQPTDKFRGESRDPSIRRPCRRKLDPSFR